MRGADHTGEIKEYGSFLHFVAEHATVATLRLLTDARLATRDTLYRRRKDGLTALDAAKTRSKTDSSWTEAFQNFLNSVDKNKNLQRTEPHLCLPHFNSPPGINLIPRMRMDRILTTTKILLTHQSSTLLLPYWRSGTEDSR